MFLPLHDRNPLKVIPLQAVTAALIAACIAVFMWQQALGEYEAALLPVRFGVTPALLVGGMRAAPELGVLPSELTLVSAMFLHGGWLHLLGNMAYLWVFGDNVEDAMGHVRFAVFYVLCGTLAAVSHAAAHPDSTAPLIGASGAVAGILGAYLVLHPRVKVLVLAFNRVPVFLPAYVLLVGWLGLQLWFALQATDISVAWWAHVGGFVAGALLVVPFRRAGVPLFDRGVPH